MKKEVRVRFAPSPTGPLHIGGLRTAMFNYYFAKKHKGKFILRLEDTDQSRSIQGADKYIVESLKWVGVVPDEGFGFGGGEYGPYQQSLRKDMYKKYAFQLLESGFAYYAFDTPEEIENMRQKFKNTNSSSYNYITREFMKNSLVMAKNEVEELLQRGTPYVIRIKIPRKENVEFTDLIRGNLVVHSSSLDDKVLFKSDGMPTYHLANVVDDFLMKITHVIRGEEWLPSLPIHIYLYKFLGIEEYIPKFAHLPLILNPDGKGKLSKRDVKLTGFPVFPIKWYDEKNDVEYEGCREKGFMPEAVTNILSLLGWHPEDGSEILSLKKISKSFSIERVSKAGAKFDPQKAIWINQQYLRLLDSKEIFDRLKDLDTHFIQNHDAVFVLQVIELFKEKLTFIGNFSQITSYMFDRPKTFNPKSLSKLTPQIMELILVFAQSIKNENPKNEEDIEGVFIQTFKKLFENTNKAMPIVRNALTGVSGGPPLFKIVLLMGNLEVYERLLSFVDDNKKV